MKASSKPIIITQSKHLQARKKASTVPIWWQCYGWLASFSLLIKILTWQPPHNFTFAGQWNGEKGTRSRTIISKRVEKQTYKGPTTMNSLCRTNVFHLVKILLGLRDPDIKKAKEFKEMLVERTSRNAKKYIYIYMKKKKERKQIMTDTCLPVSLDLRGYTKLDVLYLFKRNFARETQMQSTNYYCD